MIKKVKPRTPRYLSRRLKKQKPALNAMAFPPRKGPPYRHFPSSWIALLALRCGRETQVFVRKKVVKGIEFRIARSNNKSGAAHLFSEREVHWDAARSPATR